MPGARFSFDHHVLEVDGVRVLHVPNDDTTCSVDLIFCVGSRHETLPTRGALHALEHLVMDQVRGTALEVNASVDLELTRFEAEGRPARVGPYLTDLCEALARPPVDRLPTEARVLSAEAHSEEQETHPLLLTRYGYRDLGLCGAPGPEPKDLRVETLRSMADAWFVTGNALLVVDGPLPDDLRLPLRRGSRPAYAAEPARRFDRPYAIDVDGPACGVSLVVPPLDSSRVGVLAVDVVEERLREEIRHRSGLSYTVEADVIGRTDGSGDLLVTVDPPPERLLEASRLLVDTVLSLLREGPTEAEVDAARERLDERRAGRAGQIGTLVTHQLADLEGLPVPPAAGDRMAAVSRDDVHRLLTDAGSDVLFMLDETVREQVGDMLPVPWLELRSPAPAPAGQVFKPPLLAKLVTSAARGLQVTLHADGVTRTVDGLTDTIRWADAAGLMRIDDDDAMVFGLDGNGIPLGSAWFRHGNRLIETAVAKLPGHLVYQGANPEAGNH